MSKRICGAWTLAWASFVVSGCPEPGETMTTAAPPEMTDGSSDSSSSTASSTGPEVTTSAATTTTEATTVAASTSSGTTEAQADCDEVEFADPALEAAVRAVLLQPEGPLLGVDIAALTQIYAADVGIVSLSGIECATGLVSLTLSFNEIADIGPLAGLTQLEDLNLRSDPVADLGPLAGLTALRELVLDGAVASKLGPLAAAKQLELLDIAWAPVESLAPLAGLSALRELVAPGGAYLDVEALAGFGSLVTLDISHTAVADLGPLAGLTSLDWLRMNGTDVVDLGPLTGLPIRHLYANGARIEDLSPVATLPSPRALELMDKAIVEADALLTTDWMVPAPDQPCLEVMLVGNPLSAEALSEVLPAFCAASGAYVTADGLIECAGHSCVIP